MERTPPTSPHKSEIDKVRAYDRQMHIQKAMGMGMTREQAERHADDHMDERDESEKP